MPRRCEPTHPNAHTGAYRTALSRPPELGRPSKPLISHADRPHFSNHFKIVKAVEIARPMVNKLLTLPGLELGRLASRSARNHCQYSGGNAADADPWRERKEGNRLGAKIADRRDDAT